MHTTEYGCGRGTKTAVPINVFRKDKPEYAQHVLCAYGSTADGLAPPSAVGPGSREMCPFCGERTSRVEISTSAGTRAISMCCGVPQEFIDNYDVFSGLPEPLRQVAIDRRKAEYAAMDAQDDEDARRFRESRDVWYAKYAGKGLIKGE